MKMSCKGKIHVITFCQSSALQRRHLCKTVKSHSGAKSLIYFYIEYITFTIIWSTFKLDVTFSILRFWTWFFVVVERGGEEGYHDYFFFLFFSFDLVNFFVKCTHVLMRVPSNVVYFLDIEIQKGPWCLAKIIWKYHRLGDIILRPVPSNFWIGTWL